MKNLLDAAARIVLVLVMFLASFLAGGCAKDQASVWFFGDEELTTARLGLYVDEYTEVGGVAVWHPSGNKNVDLYGVYGLHYMGDIEAINPLTPDSDTMLVATPYVGIQSIVDLDSDFHAFTVTGLVFEKIFFVEHQYDLFDNQNSKTMAGIRIRF